MCFLLKPPAAPGLCKNLSYIFQNELALHDAPAAKMSINSRKRNATARDLPLKLGLILGS